MLWLLLEDKTDVTDRWDRSENTVQKKYLTPKVRQSRKCLVYL